MGIGIYNIFKIYILTEISSGTFLNQSKSPSERYFNPVSQATAITLDFGPKLLDNFIAPATFIPLEVPQNIPSLEASSLQVCLAKDSSIEITSSIYSEL